MNQMSSWTGEELKRCAEDDNERADKCIAAGRILDARSRDRTASGAPIAGPEVDRIMDRTDGKPVGNSNLTINGGINLGDGAGFAMDWTRLSQDQLAQLQSLISIACITPTGANHDTPALPIIDGQVIEPGASLIEASITPAPTTQPQS